MKSYILIMLFLFNGYQLLGQSLYKENIANLVTVSFPQETLPSQADGNSIVQTADSLALYSVINRNADTKQLLFYSNKLPEFYHEVIIGFTERFGGKLVNKKEFSVSGFKGIEAEFLVPPDPKLPDSRFVRVILLNNTFIVLNFWTLSKNKQVTEEARKQFFNSIVLIADPESITQLN